MPNFRNKLIMLGLLLASTMPAFTQEIIKMSTTTSTENSGLLQYLPRV